MKQTIAILLLICLIFTGCASDGSAKENQITFYYLRQQYQYGEPDGVIVQEHRDASGHRRDLNYLMALYLMGPTDESHRIPLPSGTRVYCNQLDSYTITLELSEAANVLSESEFTIACACLSLTCFNVTNAQKVTVVSGERTITMTRDTILLNDISMIHLPTEDLP
ncbi:MAG: hypothetical protein J6V25_01430 [Oscillospiraceae bacterium]|nr:hypothetical protein [Oscillospiraceae bacterium]